MINIVEKVMQLSDSFHLKISAIKLCGLKIKKVDLEELYLLLYEYQKRPENRQLYKQDMKLVDLGCWTGLVSLLMNEAKGECNGVVYSVDDFVRDEPSAMKDVAKYINIYNVLEGNYANYGVSGIIQIINKSFKEASTLFKNESLDVLFINYSHKYQDVLNDIDTWYHKVKVGGLICGHGCTVLDINTDNLDPNVPNPFNLNIGLIKAIKERFPQVKKTSKGSSIWYTYKT